MNQLERTMKTSVTAKVLKASAVLLVVGSAVVACSVEVPLGSAPSVVRPSAASSASSAAALPDCDVSHASISASSTSSDSTDDSGTMISYAAKNMIDGDPTTAWRTDGTGVGVSIVLRFAQECRLRTVSIVDGYDKDDPVSGYDRWIENRRVVRLDVSTDDGSVGTWTLSEYSRDPQTTTIVPRATARLTLTILATEPDVVKRNYTAISEIVVG